LLTFVSAKFPEVFRLTSTFRGVVVLGSLPRSLSGHSIFMISAPRAPSHRVAHGPARTQLKSTTRMFSRARGRDMRRSHARARPGNGGGRLRVDASAMMPPIHPWPTVDQEPRSAAMGPMAADPRQAAVGKVGWRPVLCRDEPGRRGCADSGRSEAARFDPASSVPLSSSRRHLMIGTNARRGGLAKIRRAGSPHRLAPFKINCELL
jgi:hypothetical protein